MNPRPLRLLAALGFLFVFIGCGTFETGSDGNPERSLTGTVNAGLAFPEGTEVVVRLLATPSATEAFHSGTNNDAPVLRSVTPNGANPERVLGEYVTKLAAGTLEPVPFQIEYHADEATLRRGLSVEARVSFGGKLRYRTVDAHVVTLASSAFRQDVTVQAVER